MTRAATHDPVDQLAEDFLERYRRGERPSISEYCQRYPAVADEVADVIRVLLLMENLGEQTNQSAEEPAFALPRQLGSYQLIREIGRGGMGVVFEAIQEELGRRVALKVLPNAAMLKPVQLERFQREARAAAQLHHTNIVPVYGVGVQDGIHYFAMQHIEGRSLDVIVKEVREERSESQSKDTIRDAITTQSTIAGHSTRTTHARTIARIGLQMAEALAHAHLLGVLHRDVKPSNIIIDTEGRAWLSDFGLATSESTEPLTQTGDIVGTLRYIAPERFSDPGDARCDIYSLGITLYETLTLRLAFEETDRAKLIHAILREEPVAPRQLDASQPRDLETIILKAIAKEPGHRYQTAQALADDLSRYLADRPVAARRLRWWERSGRWVKRNQALSFMAALVFATLLFGLGLTYWQWQRAEGEADVRRLLAEREATQRQAAEKNAQYAWRSLRGMLDGTSNLEDQPVEAIRKTMLQQALLYYQEYLANVNEPPKQFEMAMIARDLGHIQSHLGEKKEARESFEKSIALLKQLLQKNEDDVECRFQLGRCLREYADRCHCKPSTTQEESLLLSSLEHLRIVMATKPTIPARYALSQTLFALATNKSLAGAPYEPDMKESIVCLHDLCQVEQPAMSHLNRLSYCQRAYAIQLIGDKRHQDAKQQAEQALHSADRLIALFNNQREHQQRLLECCGTLADCNMRLGNYPGAETSFRRAILILRSLLEKDAYHAEHRSELAMNLHELSVAISKQADKREYLSLIDEAIDQQAKAMELLPQATRYPSRLAKHLKQHALFLLKAKEHLRAASSVHRLLQLPRVHSVDAVDAASILCDCARLVRTDKSLESPMQLQMSQQYQDQAIECLTLALKKGLKDPLVLKRSSLSILQNRDDFQTMFKSLSDPAANPK
jgi:eukaryotic-like serine/threonine-protein kinase